MRRDQADNDRRIRRRYGVPGLIGLLLVLLSGCSTEEVLRFGWPEGITSQATSMRELWTGSTLVALVVGVIVWGLIFWSCAFHRRKSADELPRQTAYNFPLEVGLVIVPLIMISVLFYFTIVVQNEVLAESTNPDVTVGVEGFQWNWEFTYADSVIEETGQPVTVLGDNEEIPVLVVPTGRINFVLSSDDVIHSFWVPATLFKRDVLPGENFGYDKDYLVTTEQEGAYVGRCAELCGIYHYAMNFELRVVSPEVFDDYLAARESGLSNAEALESVGQPGLAQTTTPFDTNRTLRSATD